MSDHVWSPAGEEGGVDIFVYLDVHVWSPAGEEGGEDIFVYLMSMSGPRLVKEAEKTYLCT